jgi:phosphoenolpyruvate carboxykinase (ATP)
MYHFLSGYTAKVAGTETGVTEPGTTFSACFGAPFLPLRPEKYADMLGERLDRHKCHTWLVNTGWTGGPPGEGSRMKLSYTRAMIHAALDGRLKDVEYRNHPVFGLSVPKTCLDVPSEVLDPKSTWKNPADYDARAKHLANLFHDNFKQFEGASKEVVAAGPA